MSANGEKKPASASPDAKVASKPSFLTNILPVWLGPALRNKRTIKTFIRCLIVFISSFILMFDDVTLKVLGQAAFFMAIVSMMLPPNMAVALFIIAGGTLVFGMLLGWAWGCAAMAASLAARSQTLLASAYENADSKLISGVAPDSQFQLFTFQGDFLDPRSSTVYGVFFFVGTFALGLLRAYLPKLALMAIFGTIVLDVMCSYGPFFPSAQYTLATLFLIPTGIYLAIAVGGIIFIFPETMNHVWLTSLDTVLESGLSILELQARVLSSETAGAEQWSAVRTAGGKYAKGMIAAVQAVLGQTAMVDLEVSVGRLGAGDLKGLSKFLNELTSRSVGLLSFTVLTDEVYIADAALEAQISLDKGASDATGGTSTPGTASRFANLRAKIKQREARHGHNLEALKPMLSESSAALREACTVALRARKDWLSAVNSSRWSFKKAPKEDSQSLENAQAQIQAVRTALAEFCTTERLKLLKPFEKFFDPATGEIRADIKAQAVADRLFAVQSLFTCFVFVTTLKAYVETLLKVLEFLVDLQKKRTRIRLWFPSGFGKLGRRLKGESQVDAPLAMGIPVRVESPVAPTDDREDDDDDEGERKEKEERPIPLDPDASPARTGFGRIQRKFAAFFHWLGTTEALYALRYSTVSICLWVIAAHPTTAYFNYANRGLWALIMAQTGMGLYAGEQIANFLVRITGTIVGLVIGMVAWYIGAGGLGIGNPYGLVVITTVLVAPFLFARVAAPPSAMTLWLMTGVMIVFVVGYSWIDGHLPAISNPGFGVSVAWRRAVTVIIGFTAAFIVMLFPRPTSARQVVRKTLATTMEELGLVFATEIDTCISQSHASSKSDEWAKQKAKRLKKIGGKLLAIAQRLQWLTPSMTTATYEPTFKGPWPADKYGKLIAAQWQFISSVVLLNGALLELDAPWLQILVHKTPFLNPNFLSDVGAAIHIVSSSLHHGYAIPGTLSPLRERLLYHERHSAAYGGPGEDDPGALEEELEADPSKVDGASIGLRSMTMDTFKDEQLIYHSTAVMAFASIIKNVDQITEIAKELCGTTAAYEGLDVLRAEYLGMEESTIRHRVEKRV